MGHEATSVETQRHWESDIKKMHLLFTLVEILAGLAICGAVAHFFMRVTLIYKITPSHLRIALFGLLPVYRIPLRDAVVRKLTYLDYLASPYRFKCLWMPNRIGWRYVLICGKTGLIRCVVVSPADPDNFIERLVASGAKMDGLTSDSLDAPALMSDSKDQSGQRNN